jgi:glycosyl transferase family 9 (putative heptosyltransferase)
MMDPWVLAMRAGDFERAWEVSDRVLAARGEQTFFHLPRHEQPVWNGTPLSGRRVLVRCYHGLGDTIHFARYFPLLRKEVRHLVVWAQPALIDLLRTMDADFELLPLHDGTPDVDYDVDVESMELAHIFRTTLATIPHDVPYLHVAPAPLPVTSSLRVGIAWRGGDWNGTRSIPFDTLRPLLTTAGVRFYALQLDIRPNETDDRITADDRRLTINGTAELIRALDLVISVDSMPAHLAGALGVPAWTLLPRDADWRWMENRSDSPWYPTMRLFRQQSGRDWRPVIDAVADALDCYVGIDRNAPIACGSGSGS